MSQLNNSVSVVGLSVADGAFVNALVSLDAIPAHIRLEAELCPVEGLRIDRLPFDNDRTDAYATAAPHIADLKASILAAIGGPISTVGTASKDGALSIEVSIASLDFSLEDWRRILNAHCGLPSERRVWFNESVQVKASRIGGGVHDDDPCPASRDLARRIAGLPNGSDLAILEVIEQFWSDGTMAESFEEKLRSIGVRLSEAVEP